jgi:arginine N-succinyltransferase
MVVIRAVTLEDLDQLVELAGQTGFGLTTLPRDRELLQGRVMESERSFERMAEKPRGETYLFVLEDLRTGRVVGTSGITSKVGGFEPFYGYRIETAVHQSDVLKVKKEIRFLKLVVEHNGPCEIASLFLAPDYRKDGNGRLLSLSRFLFMAAYPKRFDPVVIAELRGVIDEQGRSAFWDALGKHFFEVDFPTADYLSMVNKKFIADLMPTHPIYIPLLPESAQAVIGKVHEQTEPALKMLEDEGFKFAGMVDIFDAGPVVSCGRDEIRTVRQSVTAVVTDIAEGAMADAMYIIGTTRREFRACKGAVAMSKEGVRLSSEISLALGVKIGDRVRYAPARPGGAKEAKP